MKQANKQLLQLIAKNKNSNNFKKGNGNRSQKIDKKERTNKHKTSRKIREIQYGGAAPPNYLHQTDHANEDPVNHQIDREDLPFAAYESILLNQLDKALNKEISIDDLVNLTLKKAHRFWMVKAIQHICYKISFTKPNKIKTDVYDSTLFLSESLYYYNIISDTDNKAAYQMYEAEYRFYRGVGYDTLADGAAAAAAAADGSTLPASYKPGKPVAQVDIGDLILEIEEIPKAERGKPTIGEAEYYYTKYIEFIKATLTSAAEDLVISTNEYIENLRKVREKLKKILISDLIKNLDSFKIICSMLDMIDEVIFDHSTNNYISKMGEYYKERNYKLFKDSKFDIIEEYIMPNMIALCFNRKATKPGYFNKERETKAVQSIFEKFFSKEEVKSISNEIEIKFEELFNEYLNGNKAGGNDYKKNFSELEEKSIENGINLENIKLDTEVNIIYEYKERFQHLEDDIENTLQHNQIFFGDKLKNYLQGAQKEFKLDNCGTDWGEFKYNIGKIMILIYENILKELRVKFTQIFFENLERRIKFIIDTHLEFNRFFDLDNFCQVFLVRIGHMLENLEDYDLKDTILKSIKDNIYEKISKKVKEEKIDEYCEYLNEFIRIAKAESKKDIYSDKKNFLNTNRYLAELYKYTIHYDMIEQKNKLEKIMETFKRGENGTNFDVIDNLYHSISVFLNIKSEKSRAPANTIEIVGKGHAAGAEVLGCGEVEMKEHVKLSYESNLYEIEHYGFNELKYDIKIQKNTEIDNAKFIKYIKAIFKNNTKRINRITIYRKNYENPLFIEKKYIFTKNKGEKEFRLFKYKDGKRDSSELDKFTLTNLDEIVVEDIDKLLIIQTKGAGPPPTFPTPYLKKEDIENNIMLDKNFTTNIKFVQAIRPKAPNNYWTRIFNMSNKNKIKSFNINNFIGNLISEPSYMLTSKVSARNMVNKYVEEKKIKKDIEFDIEDDNVYRFVFNLKDPSAKNNCIIKIILRKDIDVRFIDNIEKISNILLDKKNEDNYPLNVLTSSNLIKYIRSDIKTAEFITHRRDVINKNFGKFIQSLLNDDSEFISYEITGPPDAAAVAAAAATGAAPPPPKVLLKSTSGEEFKIPDEEYIYINIDARTSGDKSIKFEFGDGVEGAFNKKDINELIENIKEDDIEEQVFKNKLIDQDICLSEFKLGVKKNRRINLDNLKENFINKILTDKNTKVKELEFYDGNNNTKINMGDNKSLVVDKNIKIKIITERREGELDIEEITKFLRKEIPEDSAENSAIDLLSEIMQNIHVKRLN